MQILEQQNERKSTGRIIGPHDTYSFEIQYFSVVLLNSLSLQEMKEKYDVVTDEWALLSPSLSECL